MPAKKPELELTLPLIDPLPEIRLIQPSHMVRSRKDASPRELAILDNLHVQLVEMEGVKEEFKYAEAATAELVLFTGNVYERTVLYLEGQIKDTQGADYHGVIKKFDEHLMQASAQDYLRLRSIGTEYIAKVAAEDLNPPPAQTAPPPRGFFGRLGYLLTGR